MRKGASVVTGAALLASAVAATQLSEASADPVPETSPAVLVNEVTGAEATTNTLDKWGVGATDLGIMWEDGKGRVLTAFGDTFLTPGSEGAGVDEWRSNILLRSSDKDLSDGMAFDWALTNEQGRAKEIFGSKKIDNEEMTTIPTAGIAVGERQYLDYMSVRHWGEPGRWDTNFAQLAWSDDGGQTWSTEGAARFENPDGNDPMQMKAFVRDGDFVYIFGTPNGRFGDVHLARVDVTKDKLENRDAWQWWSGSQWSSNYADLAVVSKGPASELSVRKVRDDLWQLVTLDGNADLALLTAPSPTGPWGNKQILATQRDYPGLYGGYIHPWSGSNELYYLQSQWNDYNVALMHVTLDDKGTIIRPNLITDPSAERSKTLDVPGGWRATNIGGIDTVSAWAKMGRNQWWVRGGAGEHLMVQNVAVTPYTDYRLTGWLRTGGVDGADARGKGRFGVREIDGAMSVIKEDNFVSVPAWRKFSIEFNSGTNRTVQVFAGSVMDGDRWVQGDDFSLVALGEPTREAPPQLANDKPAVVPALTSWTKGEGSWKLGDNTRIVGPAEFAASAELLSKEIASYRKGEPAAYVNDGATAADIHVAIDPSRSDLGKEGYDLTIGSDGVKIVGATKAGAFYGTRTVSQLLRQDLTLPAGHTIDKPKYPERGLTLSAYEVNITNEWIDRMLTEMADIKLNQVLLQIKVKSDKFPNLNTWSYYTKEQVRAFVEKAEAYGIEVIPEINAPGHMDVVLENYPEFQLVDDNGKHQPNQLDVCNAKAVQFYLDLMDEYLEVFKPRQWHIGSDEYMLHKNPANYKRLIKCVSDRYGEDAVDKNDAHRTINNAVFDFVNKVNAHAKSKGVENLRMWNDGLRGSTKVQLDTDIIVEHWIDWGENPKETLARGHKMQNASLAFYDTRDPNNKPIINAEQQWVNGWNVGRFFGGHGSTSPDNPQLLGAKASMWVDSAWAQTENFQGERVRDGLRVLSQLTWKGDRDQKLWSEFKADIDRIGRTPAWNNIDDQAVAPGTYRIALQRDKSKVLGQTGIDAKELGTDSWTLTPTTDRYYQLRSSITGQCLTLSEGKKTLGVVTEIGAAPTLEPCGNVDDQLNNAHKWQFLKADDGSFVVRHALTGQTLAVTQGTEQRPDQANYPGTTLKGGLLAQLPPDVTSDRWVLEPTVSVQAKADKSTVWAGEQTSVSLTITNNSSAPLANAKLEPRLPQGWSVAELPQLKALGAGESVTVDVVVRNDNSAVGQAFLPISVVWDGGVQTGGITLDIPCGKPTSPKFVSASDEQVWGERGQQPGRVGSGWGNAAVDGDPASYWHSNWDRENTPYPHHLVVDTGKVQQICGLSYLPRTDGEAAGRAKTYNVYVSDDNKTWTKVTDGEMEHRFGWQQLPVGASGRYIKFEGTSSWPEDDRKGFGNPWMAVAELMFSTSSVEVLPGRLTLPEMKPAVVDRELPTEPTPTVTVTPTVTADPVVVTPTVTGAPITVTPTVTGEPVVVTPTVTGAPITIRPTTTAEPVVVTPTVTGAPITVTPTVTAPKPSTPAPKPTAPVLKAPYEVPGFHVINGRHWNTTCEPYGNTIRCWTYIWSKQAVKENGQYRLKEGWHFNNLTYLPYLTKAQWGTHHLANTGEYNLNGRKWRTECNTKVTGKNACRSYIWATVIVPQRDAQGRYTFRQNNQWVFNNMVRFKVS